MRNKRLYLVILVAVALLISPSLLLSQAVELGQIAFVSDRDGNREIYMVNADGTGLTNLTNHPAEDYSPVWSPDGEQLAFVSDRSGTGQIYIMAADGSDVRQLTDVMGSVGKPVWAPDGSKIAFKSQIGFSDQVDIYWLNIDGSGLTQVYSQSGFGGRISWSPNGQQLLFDNNPDDNFDLFLVDLDGSNLRTFASGVTTGGPSHGKPSWELEPAWSPDGVRLAFVTTRLRGHVDIFVTDPLGHQMRNLTPDTGANTGPVWSPDSRWLAFAGAGISGAGLHITDPDSGETILLSEVRFGGADFDKSWSPDSNYIVYADRGDEQNDIFLVAVDGSSLVNLTDHPANDQSPVWRPVPPSPLAEGLIAYIGDDLNIWLINTDRSEARQLTDHITERVATVFIGYEELKWSPDGSMLAYISRERLDNQSRETLWLYQLASNSHQELVSEPFFNGFDWAPDSSSIVYGPAIPESYWRGETDPTGPIRGIWQVDIATGHIDELVGPELGYPLARPKWSHDGGYLSFEQIQAQEGSGGLVVYNMETRVYPPNQGVLRGNIDWSPLTNLRIYDKVVYRQVAGSQIWIVDAIGVKTFWLTAVRNTTGDYRPQFSPTGEHVGFLRVRPNNAYGPLWIVNADAFYGDGSTERQLSRSNVHDFSWAATGEWLVVAQGNYSQEELFIVDLNGNARYLAKGRSPAWQPVFTSANPPGYSVSGQILDVYGFSVSGITVNLDGERGTETDDQGAFSFENVTAGVHSFQVMITDGYRFEPAKREIELAGDLSDLDFTAIPVTDSGFRPDRNGYSFENRVLDRSWDMFEQYFGREQVTHPDGTRCAVAEEFYQQEYRRAGRGFSCVGFSLTSLISHLEWPQPNAGSFAIDSFETLYDQPISARLTDAIAYYSGTQRGQQWGDAYRSGLAKCTSDSGYMIEEIIAGIEGGAPPVLVLNSGLNNTWHVVTPYRVEKLTAARADVFIYDNEAPGEEHVVRFEQLGSEWRWTYTFIGTLAGAGTRIGTCSDLVLFSLAASTQRGIPPINFCSVSEVASLTRQILVHIPAGVDLSLENSDGQRLGWEEGSLMSVIPGAYELLSGFGLQSLDSRTVLLPQDAYKFYLSAGRDGETGVTVFSDGRFLSVARQVGESDSVLELATGQTLNQATLSSASHLGQVSIRFGLEQDHSRLVSLSAELQDQPHQIEVYFDGTSLSLSHDAREPADYSVSFGRGLEAVPLSDTFRLEGSAAIKIQPTSWDNLETASVEREIFGSTGMPVDSSVEETASDDSEARSLTLSQRLSQILTLNWVRISGGLLAGVAIFGLVAITVRRYRQRTLKAVLPGPNRFCVHCGAEYPAAGKFCIKCGQKRDQF